jgi:DNA polymerase-3 subunit epsilon/ATP-dependent DNA helicase DinG
MNDVLVALDVEATGMDPKRDQIIEIGAVKFRGRQIIDRFSSLVKPSGPVSYSIERLTGIQNDELREAPRFSTVGPKLREFVGQSAVVGQSVEFDIQMLRSAGLTLNGHVFDTFELATILLPDLPTYSLRTIAVALEIDIEERHRALADAETTVAVFNALSDRADAFDDATVERLDQLTLQAGSSLNHLFRSLLRERRREVASLGGSSIGAALLAKLSGAPGISTPEAPFLVPRERPKRLEAVERGAPIASETLDAAMAGDGPFARVLPGFEERPQQVEVMHAIANNLNDGGRLLVEAGTGTGKSLGYLVPAALHAVNHGDPVVISTATIALQDQLISKDIPDLRRAAEAASLADGEAPLQALRDLKATVLKGRANYLCLRRWFLAQREEPADQAQAALYAKITAWLHQTETGDRSELRLSPEQQAHWLRLAEEEGSCLPAQCLFHRRNQCFLFRARQTAEASHVVIVNHSLLLSDILRGGSVLPPFSQLVVDEAHHLEDEATVQAGFSVSRNQALHLFGRVLAEQEPIGLTGALGLAFRSVAATPGEKARGVAGSLDAIAKQAGESIREATTRVDSVFRTLDDIVERYDQDASGYERRVRVTDAMRSDPAWSQIEIEWDAAAEPITQIATCVARASEEISTMADGDLPARQEILTEFDLVHGELTALRSRMYAMLTDGSDDLICWLSRHQTTQELSVRAVPLHVAGLLDEKLYSRCQSVTLTSATLTVEGSFDFVRDRLGLGEAEEIAVPSPFDYRRSTLLAMADDVPEPNQPGHQKRLHEALIQICLASKGRAMLLFTSHSALHAAYHAIKRPLEASGILVLGQRVDGSPRQLVERLMAENSTIILGTNSFWEGVDIAGEALSTLVITRLPFSVPSDPVFAARGELFDNPFVEYGVPQAILRFKQGFGRLIRSADDRGACVVLDSRIVKRRYGEAFVESLPECETLVGPAVDLAGAVERWLAQR